jgi:hypothetical protein
MSVHSSRASPLCGWEAASPHGRQAHRERLAVLERFWSRLLAIRFPFIQHDAMAVMQLFENGEQANIRRRGDRLKTAQANSVVDAIRIMAVAVPHYLGFHLNIHFCSAVLPRE